MHAMEQPNLFQQTQRRGTLEDVALYALGDFQSRGKALANRELALDRLLGAFHRAAEVFAIDKLSDEDAITGLRALGATIRNVPAFVAKHPYRIIVGPSLAEASQDFYKTIVSSGIPALK